MTHVPAAAVRNSRNVAESESAAERAVDIRLCQQPLRGRIFPSVFYGKLHFIAEIIVDNSIIG